MLTTCKTETYACYCSIRVAPTVVTNCVPFVVVKISSHPSFSFPPPRRRASIYSFNDRYFTIHNFIRYLNDCLLVVSVINGLVSLLYTVWNRHTHIYACVCVHIYAHVYICVSATPCNPCQSTFLVLKYGFFIGIPCFGYRDIELLKYTLMYSLGIWFWIIKEDMFKTKGARFALETYVN